MSPKDKTLATFQIDQKKWNKFKRLTGNQSASAVLVEFIERFLDNPNILEQSNFCETSNIEYQSITDYRIKAVEERLGAIEADNQESKIGSKSNYITNLELTEILDRLKTLESKSSDIEKSNLESVINLAIQSISNLEGRYKELEDKLSIIESSNHQSVTNSDREYISNIESAHPSAITEHINQEERDQKVGEALELAKSELGVSARKKVLQEKAAELLNQWQVLDKSGNQSKWTWTKVRDYFKK